MSMTEYKCPNCGAGIQFSPGTTELRCAYCESKINIEVLIQSQAREQEPSVIQADWQYEGSDWTVGAEEGMVVYSCQSCSAEIVGDHTLGATTCPFCDNPVVMTATFSGSLKPDLIIPFQVSREEAQAALKKHYLGKRLLPSVFKSRNHLEEVKGVYVPFWLFDADADARIHYDAKTIRAWSDSSYDYTETSVYKIEREGSLSFDAIPIDGAKAIDDTVMESIEPYDLSAAIDFNSAYLAGFFANKYDVDAETSIGRAEERSRNSTIRAFEETVRGYDQVSAVRSDIRINQGRVRYALLPVWFLSTRWQDQSYSFAMNGQTGKFVGDLPMDKRAYVSWLLKLFGISFVVLLIIGQIIAGWL